MKKGTILEGITVEKLVYGGKGLAHTPEGKAIMITGGAIPESIVNLKVIKTRKNHLECQIVEVMKKSHLEQDLSPDMQVTGGCKWLPIPYEKQVEIKESQIREIFSHPQFSEESFTFHPIVASPETLGYRNKLEFSWGKYISKKEDIHEEYRFGFHAQGAYDRIIDCHNCVLGDEVVNELFKAFDTFARSSELPTYDQKFNKGFWRHLVIRRGMRTNETMVVLSCNLDYFDEVDGEASEESKNSKKDFMQELTSFMGEQEAITSGWMLNNNGKADIVDGEAMHLRGNETITESLSIPTATHSVDAPTTFGGTHTERTFHIAPKSFFQTNTLGCERLYACVRGLIQNTGGHLLDLYAGTGTIGIVMADIFEEVTSVEVVESASADNEKNASLNTLNNINVINGKVETLLPTIQSGEASYDTLILDPPRAGLHPKALAGLPGFGADEIIYVSCNPSTLSRDAQFLISEEGGYTMTNIIPVDMFPHTHHIETIVRFEKRKTAS